MKEKKRMGQFATRILQRIRASLQIAGLEIESIFFHPIRSVSTITQPWRKDLMQV